MLNRAVLIIRYKQPFVDWINAADPNPTHTITLDDANEDTTAYLVDVEDQDELDRRLKRNAVALFKRWCTLELHSVVHDTGGPPLGDDEA
jgi:hypothetical protein